MRQAKVAAKVKGGKVQENVRLEEKMEGVGSPGKRTDHPIYCRPHVAQYTDATHAEACLLGKLINTRSSKEQDYAMANGGYPHVWAHDDQYCK